MSGESADGTIDRGIALLTDGGGAVQEEQEDDAEQGDEEAEDAEVEEQPEDEEQQEHAEDAQEEEAEDEQEAEAEDEEGIPEEDEDAEGVHSGGAESVYESEEATGVLHLDLDGLALDLLGLEVHLDEVVLDVSARPGDNNLVGNLLSAVTGLLDGLAASPMEAAKNALGTVKDKLAGVLPSFGDIKDKLAGFLPDFGGIKNAILGLIPGIRGGDEEASEEGAEAEDEDEAEGGDEAESEEEREESPGVPARLKGWIGDRIRGALSALPIQEVAANVAREMLRELIEQIESKDKQEPKEGGVTAEAQS